jgi:hypothetical protein
VLIAPRLAVAFLEGASLNKLFDSGIQIRLPRCEPGTGQQNGGPATGGKDQIVNTFRSVVHSFHPFLSVALKVYRAWAVENVPARA